MEGGIQVHSYARNSTSQASAFSCIIPALTDAIASSSIVPRSTIRIADLGCASGSNTIDAVSFVVGAMRSKYKLASSAQPEFQAFFSDLAANDFNTLFSLLSSGEGDGCEREYLAAGVPGSFYERLFPCSSIHFAMCNVALHWLSKVPDAVLERDSASWNAGRVWLGHGAKAEVVRAYAQQAHDDLCKFLRCRAHEIAPGGLLVLFMNGRTDKDPSLQAEGESNFMNWMGGCFELAWRDLVAEGLIEQETLDSFNMPSFHRSLDEIPKAVEETGNAFSILRLEILNCAMPSYASAKALMTPEQYAFKEAMMCKSICKRMAQEHLGDAKLVEELFERVQRRLLPKEPVPLRHAPMLFAILQLRQ